MRPTTNTAFTKACFLEASITATGEPKLINYHVETKGRVKRIKEMKISISCNFSPKWSRKLNIFFAFALYFLNMENYLSPSPPNPRQDMEF